jgi:uncharacterized protein
MSKTVVIYHGGCTDGWCAAWILHRCFGGVELHSARHGDDPPNVKDRDVVVVDFSYDKKTMVRMSKECKSILVFDHHATAQKHLEGLSFCHFDMEKSGAMLSYDYCNREGYISAMSLSKSKKRRTLAAGMRLLALYVQDSDLWTNRLPSTESINACVRSYRFDMAEWDDIASRAVLQLDSLIAEGDAVLRYRRNLIEQHKKRVDESRVDIGGHLVRIVECTCREIVSDLLNELAKGEPFSASYYMQSEQMMFSLRSESGGVNVAEVAEGYGGGGHRNSAGFCIPRSGAIKV